MLKLNGIDVYVSGVAGHFVGSADCALRMSWRIGDLLISTVGGYCPNPARTPGYQHVGSDRYWETFVFAVDDDGTPEGDHDGSPVWTTSGPGMDTRFAEEMHGRVARAVAVIVRDGIVDPLAVSAALNLAIEPDAAL